MRIAAVDIGTNTVRCLVADEHGVVERSEFITGLGRGVDATGLLADVAVQRTLRALREIAPAVVAADRIRVVATSASRDAGNRAAFFSLVGDTLGTEPELLSGLEEARLAFVGVVDGGAAMQTTVVDLGGGSTEIITGHTHPEFQRSFDIGSVRATDRYLPDQPAGPDQIAAARSGIVESLGEMPIEPGKVVGVGGTFETLAMVSAGSVDGVVLTAGELEALVDRFAGMTVDALTDRAGVPAERAPVILGGALVASTVVELLGAGELAVTERGLVDGLAADLLLAQS